MKYLISFWAVTLATGLLTQADPLDRQHVAADAKWLVHVDLDDLRQSRIGTFLMTNLVAPQIAEIGGELKFNASNLLEHVSSLTAYGSDFKTGPDATGVLLINSDPDTHKALEGLLVAQVLANTNGPVKKLEGAPRPVYSVGKQIFVSPIVNGPIVVSKSEKQLDVVQELLSGKSPALDPNQSLGRFAVLTNRFFLLGIADLANLPNVIPAKAKVLQMADGGRVAVGEKDDQVCVDLALRGKSAEVTREIQQVVEGMVALVSLGQPENPDIVELAKSLKVSADDELLTVDVQLPAGKVIDRLQQEMSDKKKGAEPHHHVKKAKKGHKAEQTLAPEDSESDSKKDK